MQKNYTTQDLKSQLNQAQYEAVTTTEGPVLVIAGAGSGKTRVIEYRSLYLVRQNVDPESILLLTFTRRSAQEMIERASRNDPRCAKIDGGTFHSFASKVFRRFSSSLGFLRLLHHIRRGRFGRGHQALLQQDGIRPGQGVPEEERAEDRLQRVCQQGHDHRRPQSGRCTATTMS